ncbi:MAG: FAD-dependent oxidoreductase, partial [Nitrospirota bacterium]
MEIREAKRLGIAAQVTEIDFPAIMERMRGSVKESHDRMQKAMGKAEEFDFYGGEARFTGDYTLEVTGKQFKGKTIFLVTGARPLIPPVKGIEAVPYLTNESALQLRERPESMVIIGGGYIAVEFAHFFDAVGAKVTILQRNKRLVPEEEPEVSELLKTSLSRRMAVHTNTEAVEVRQDGAGITVISRDRESGKELRTTAQHLLIAAGRKSNADILKVENTGVKTDERGYIVVDEHFETTKKNIWSFGDAIGKKMFRHAANREAELVWHNALHGKKSRLNYLTVPHAVFSWPEIASVGLTEAEAVKLMG